jgi:hypothetical protein
MESNGEWLLRRARVTQGCSVKRMDGECLKEIYY